MEFKQAVKKESEKQSNNAVTKKNRDKLGQFRKKKTMNCLGIKDLYPIARKKITRVKNNYIMGKLKKPLALTMTITMMNKMTMMKMTMMMKMKMMKMKNNRCPHCQTPFTFSNKMRRMTWPDTKISHWRIKSCPPMS